MLFVGALLPLPTWALEFSGRVGGEVDGLEERFGTETLFDSRSPSATPGRPESTDQRTQQLRFLDRSTVASGLLDLRLEQRGDNWFRLHGVIRGARVRTRGDLETAAGAATALGAISLNNRVLFEGGPGGHGGGADDIVTGTLARRDLPGKLQLRLNSAGEFSWAGHDSLARLFDYRVFRPSGELRRTIGLSGDLALRAGMGRKWVRQGAVGAYRGQWAELEWSQTLAARHPWSVSARQESRRYLQSAAMAPSYREISLEAQGEVGLPWEMRARFEPSVRDLRYANGSVIDSLAGLFDYQDYRSAEGTLKIETSWQGLRRAWRGGARSDRDSLELLEELSDSPDWTLGFGARYGLLRHRTAGNTDYHTLSGLLTLDRAGSERFWFDFSLELGRRSYRDVPAGTGLVYDGLSLTLSGTDYSFVSTSLLGDWALGRGFRLQAFCMYDRETHALKGDNFSLWSFTSSFTRSF